ncbi:hypothetical protein PGB90_007944 [Kerria lacca]
MIKMHGFYANGSFTDVTGCNIFSPMQPQFLPLSLPFNKRIPAEFCTFEVIRPSRIYHPNIRSQLSADSGKHFFDTNVRAFRTPGFGRTYLIVLFLMSPTVIREPYSLSAHKGLTDDGFTADQVIL